METAVLFIVFSRPDTTARVFEAIRAARPARLYVAADGPRAGRAGEAERCAEVRRIATAIDWPCTLHTLFRDANLGCKRGVSSAIDWFFENEAEGIILEDDILPQPAFFPYCEALLDRYRDDQRVAMISGCSFIGDPAQQADYVFSRYLHVWGWASWRRAWQHYDVDMAGWPGRAASARLVQVLGGRADVIAYWTSAFDAVQRGDIDTWDYQWVYSSWMADMLAIMPNGMLIDNLGYGDGATHTAGDAPVYVRTARVADIAFPLKAPVPGPTTVVDMAIEHVALERNSKRRLRQLVRQTPIIGDALTRYRAARGRR